MNFKRLAKRTEIHEGFRTKPYKDTEGYWTIGIGNRFMNGKEVTENTPPCTYAEAVHELYADLYEACVGAQNYYPDLDYLPVEKQEVLVELCYQLGYDELCRFVKTKECLLRGDYTGASKQLRSSLLYRQTPNRTEELAKILEA